MVLFVLYNKVGLGWYKFEVVNLDGMLQLTRSSGMRGHTVGVLLAPLHTVRWYTTGILVYCALKPKHAVGTLACCTLAPFNTMQYALWYPLILCSMHSGTL